MKQIYCILAFLMLFAGLMWAQKGEKSLGMDLGYSTKFEQTGLGIRFQYQITQAVRIAPSVNYFFENDREHSAFGFNFDVHRVFSLNQDLKLYPLAGIGFLSYDHGDDGVGFNLGGGIEFNLAPEWICFGEAKYSALFSAPDNETISIGIAYQF